MASGIYTAVSGAKANQDLVDSVANNLANMDTPAYKKDMPNFKEYLAIQETPAEAQEVKRGPIKDKDFYPLDQRDQSFVVTNGTYVQFRQGGLKVTQNPLDFALDGPGFFEISTPNGIRYTKQGSFKMSTEGLLVTSEGYPVLMDSPEAATQNAQSPATVQPSQGRLSTQGGVAVEQGPVPAERFINLLDQAGKKISVTESGNIYAGDTPVAKLKIAEFEDVNQLRKDKGQTFVANVKTSKQIPTEKTKLHQGMIEMSNVNPVEEMTNLIKAHRMYEMNMKALKTYDELMAKENSIGKF
jgi:flagellar basal-body rod protein FlgF